MTIREENDKSAKHPSWIDAAEISWHTETDSYGRVYETDVYVGRYGVVRKCDGIDGWSGRVYRAPWSDKAVPRGADDAPEYQSKREAMAAVEARLREIMR